MSRKAIDSPQEMYDAIMEYVGRLKLCESDADAVMDILNNRQNEECYASLKRATMDPEMTDDRWQCRLNGIIRTTKNAKKSEKSKPSATAEPVIPTTAATPSLTPHPPLMPMDAKDNK